MRHTLKFPLRALLILFLSLAGCRQPNPNQLRSEPLTAEETVVQAEAGQSFTIVLPGLGTPANYKWVLQDSYNKALIRFEGERDAASEFPERPPPGYAPKRVFSLRALTVGRSELVFTQAPVTAGSPPSTTVRRFPVEIRAALTPVAAPAR